MEDISKLRYLKHWSQQCVLTAGSIANGVLITSWLASMRALDASGSKPLAAAVSVAVVTASIGVSYYYAKHKENLVKKHGEIFTSKAQAKKVIVRAAAVMDYIDEKHGIEKLETGLISMNIHIRRTNTLKHSMLHRASIKQQPPTPGGFHLNGENSLPADTEAAFAIVMHEALFDYVSTYSNYSEYVGIDKKTKLPKRAQDYIIEYNPELLMLDPTLFDADSLNKHAAGLAHVVQTLVSLACVPGTMHEQIKAWKDSGDITSGPDAQLPDNLMSYGQ